MRIIINGCNGKLGREISTVIENRKDTVVTAGISRSGKTYKNQYSIYKSIQEVEEVSDLIIDCSNPAALPKLLKFAENKNLPILIATTGFSKEEMNEIEKASEKIPIMITANTSLGLNLLISLVKKAATILEEDFDIEIIERHHNKKLDSPSGSAFMIAEGINEELEGRKDFVLGRRENNKKREKKEIGIHAVRGGNIYGEHTVSFCGMGEVIEIEHKVLSREVFAAGALKCGEFLINKEPKLYTMEDLFGFK